MECPGEEIERHREAIVKRMTLRFAGSMLKLRLERPKYRSGLLVFACCFLLGASALDTADMSSLGNKNGISMRIALNAESGGRPWGFELTQTRNIAGSSISWGPVESLSFDHLENFIREPDLTEAIPVILKNDSQWLTPIWDFCTKASIFVFSSAMLWAQCVNDKSVLSYVQQFRDLCDNFENSLLHITKYQSDISRRVLKFFKGIFITRETNPICLKIVSVDTSSTGHNPSDITAEEFSSLTANNQSCSSSSVNPNPSENQNINTTSNSSSSTSNLQSGGNAHSCSCPRMNQDIVSGTGVNRSGEGGEEDVVNENVGESVDDIFDHFMNNFDMQPEEVVGLAEGLFGVGGPLEHVDNDTDDHRVPTNGDPLPDLSVSVRDLNELLDNWGRNGNGYGFPDDDSIVDVGIDLPFRDRGPVFQNEDELIRAQQFQEMDDQVLLNGNFRPETPEEDRNRDGDSSPLPKRPRFT